MRLFLSVEGPPPVRADPGRSADRSSPNAEPLALAAEALMVKAPMSFALREPFGITGVFGSTKPPRGGHGAIDPIIEVLVDVGVLEDERLEDWERELQDPDVGELYTVTVEPTGTPVSSL
jgi:hypothetical protein